MKWRIYSIGIRDYHPTCAVTIEEYRNRLRGLTESFEPNEDDYKEARACYLSATNGGETLRDTVWVFWDWRVDGPGFIFKEDNNGTTYMVVRGIDVDIERQDAYGFPPVQLFGEYPRDTRADLEG